MSEQLTQTPAPEPVASIAKRVSTPFLIFSASLFVLLALSWIFLLPRFTQVTVADVSLSPTEMQSYVLKLQADVTSMEHKRNDLVLPLQNAQYSSLKNDRTSMPSVIDIRRALRDAASRITDAGDHIVFEDMSYDLITKTATVTGDVRGIGPRSMTILASYIDGVAALPFIDHLTRPAFTRVDDGHGNIHSPFTMTFTIKPLAQ